MEAEYIYNTSTVFRADSLVVFDRETGELAWKATTSVQATTIAGDVLYAGTENCLLLFDKYSGEEIDMLEISIPIEGLVAYKDRLIVFYACEEFILALQILCYRPTRP